MQRLWMVIPGALSICAMAGAASDPGLALANEAYPRVAEISRILTVDRWSDRVDSLLQAAPTAAVAGENWHPGDTHWEAAKSRILEHIDGWLGDLLADPHPKDIVRQAFARDLTVERAGALRLKHLTAPASQLPALADGVHLRVLFAEQHPELKIGSREYSEAWARWFARLKLGPDVAAPSDELMAFLNSAEGRAYEQARGSAIDSLIIALDGQIKLRMFDMQAALVEEIGKEAEVCAAAHR